MCYHNRKLVKIEEEMQRIQDWITPIFCFCIFLIIITIVVLLTYEKSTLVNQIQKTQEPQQSITNVQEFQKALNSSLK